MMVEFLDPAATELINAIVYYNSESEGLGYEFAAEANRTIGRMMEYPNAWASLSRRTRRCRTNRFPYGVVYQLQGDLILIVAVMHLHREPETWKGRLPPGVR
jgi:hypothetical protein